MWIEKLVGHVQSDSLNLGYQTRGDVSKMDTRRLCSHGRSRECTRALAHDVESVEDKLWLNLTPAPDRRVALQGISPGTIYLRTQRRIASSRRFQTTHIALFHLVRRQLYAYKVRWVSSQGLDTPRIEIGKACTNVCSRSDAQCYTIGCSFNIVVCC